MDSIRVEPDALLFIILSDVLWLILRSFNMFGVTARLLFAFGKIF